MAEEKDDPIEVLSPDDAECGPAMLACTPLERKFVVALVEGHARNHTQAALMAGKYTSRQSAGAAAWRWMASQRVLLALKEWTQHAMEGDVYLGRRALREIVSDPMHKDRFKAVVELFNRNGMLVETVQRHIVEDRRDTREIVLAAIDMARQLGDPRLAYKLLGNSVPTDIIDAEFSEVKETVKVETGSEGLEDILA